jgi:hypothetical protein
MFKIAWAYMVLSALVAAAGVGAYLYIAPAATGQSVPPSATAHREIAPSTPRDEDVKRKILNGIGSIRDLNPVPQQSVLRR